jgi:hypothetical protein
VWGERDPAGVDEASEIVHQVPIVLLEDVLGEGVGDDEKHTR